MDIFSHEIKQIICNYDYAVNYTNLIEINYAIIGILLCRNNHYYRFDHPDECLEPRYVKFLYHGRYGWDSPPTLKMYNHINSSETIW